MVEKKKKSQQKSEIKNQLIETDGNFEKWSSKDRISQEILTFQLQMDAQLLTKANFIFWAATAVAFFMLSKIIAVDFLVYHILIRAAIVIIFVGAGCASIMAMLIILPKIRLFSSKDRSKHDVFYYKNICRFYTEQSLFEYLSDLPDNRENLLKAYGHQIYTLATRVIPFKVRLLKMAGWTLIISGIIGTLVIIVRFLVLICR